MSAFIKTNIKASRQDPVLMIERKRLVVEKRRKSAKLLSRDENRGELESWELMSDLFKEPSTSQQHVQQPILQPEPQPFVFNPNHVYDPRQGFNQPVPQFFDPPQPMVLEEPMNECVPSEELKWD